jgi:hypothetical protein
MRSPPAIGTVTLSSSGVGSDSTAAHTSARSRLPARIQGAPSALAGSLSVQTVNAAAAAAPKTTKAKKPTQVFPAFQGRRGPPSRCPATEAIPSPQASTPHTAAAIHSSCRKASTSASTDSG